MSKCPVEGCKDAVKAGHLMCLKHWRLVPTRLQRAVNSTWRSYKAKRDMEALDAYRAARDAAVRAAAAEDTSARQGGLL